MHLSRNEERTLSMDFGHLAAVIGSCQIFVCLAGDSASVARKTLQI